MMPHSRVLRTREIFIGKVFRIGTVRYNWPMSAHASRAFSIAHCTDSEDLPWRFVPSYIQSFGVWTQPMFMACTVSFYSFATRVEHIGYDHIGHSNIGHRQWRYRPHVGHGHGHGHTQCTMYTRRLYLYGTCRTRNISAVSVLNRTGNDVVCMLLLKMLKCVNLWNIDQVDNRMHIDVE